MPANDLGASATRKIDIGEADAAYVLQLTRGGGEKEKEEEDDHKRMPDI
jgi:hypothetical protein